ncbi:DUF2789 domain-containing protein [Pseudomonas sp. GD03944]|uniref:DUF2789 domain-containing protein n=1 Tax=Pseudomonas sp. GD03944 TaxID=2975409 RepID=UPI00244998A8|nr:DUF2789 domain-containing protein [Pseudomonas sp. GD03944]MDH1263036.1 DUF2789 domain-containing protein [Pseudomonas sp. GD03944]
MENPVHDLSALFKQLGLPADQASIDRFIRDHSPLAPTCKLSEAPFWNKAQAALLREELLEDADWAVVVDQLNVRLRG